MPDVRSPEPIPPRPLPQVLEDLLTGECLRFGVEQLNLPRYLTFDPALGVTIVIERTETGLTLTIEPPPREEPIVDSRGDWVPITHGS